MGRFNSFNELMSSGSNSAIEADNDEKENEDEETPVVVTEFEEEQRSDKIYSDCEVELPKEEEEITQDFYQNVFWGKTDSVPVDEMDSMFEDYE